MEESEKHSLPSSLQSDTLEYEDIVEVTDVSDYIPEQELYNATDAQRRSGKISKEKNFDDYAHTLEPLVLRHMAHLIHQWL